MTQLDFIDFTSHQRLTRSIIYNTLKDTTFMKFIRRKGKTAIRQLKIDVALGFQSIKNNITGKRQNKKKHPSQICANHAITVSKMRGFLNLNFS